MDKLKNFGRSGKKDPDEFAAGGFTGSEGAAAAQAAPAAASTEKKEPEKKAEEPKKDKEPPKKEDKGYAKGGYVKPPRNNLAATIGRLGRFN
jgi:hypothetical protein